MGYYRISFTMDTDGMATFLREVGPLLGPMTISWKSEQHSVGTSLSSTTPETPSQTDSIFPDLPYPTTVDKPKPKAKRKIQRLRKSKVNDTIITLLTAAPATIKLMKEALSEAGLSPGSLSTGLATLQREGRIERAAAGLYQLTAAAVVASEAVIEPTPETEPDPVPEDTTSPEAEAAAE